MLKNAFNECPSERSKESQHLFSKRCRGLSTHSARQTGFFRSLLTKVLLNQQTQQFAGAYGKFLGKLKHCLLLVTPHNGSEDLGSQFHHG